MTPIEQLRAIVEQMRATVARDQLAGKRVLATWANALERVIQELS